jgi:hypothetical protein
MHRLIMIATRGVTEILGLVPSNPRRNTSGSLLEVLRIGNKVATCCCFVAALLPLFRSITNQETTKRQHVATLQLPIFIGDADYYAG